MSEVDLDALCDLLDDDDDGSGGNMDDARQVEVILSVLFWLIWTTCVSLEQLSSCFISASRQLHSRRPGQLSTGPGPVKWLSQFTLRWNLIILLD